MAYNHLRSRRRLWARNKILVPDNSDRDENPADLVTKSETRDQVRSALAKLPERQTQLLLLRQMGLSYAELAGCFDVAPSSVGTLLARAADAFRKAYRGEPYGET
jgi:RNA polymerase sigma-70 factor (ECF subfamily)